MTDTIHDKKTAVAPKFLFTLEDMGLTSSVKDFEDYIPVESWGLDSNCYASAQVAGAYAQQDPLSSGPLYLRLPLGLHVPKLFKHMITKKSIPKGQLVMLANVGGKTNVEIMELNIAHVSVEEILLGNSTRGRHNKNNQQIDNNQGNTFEVFLRFGKIEWVYYAFKQDGRKEGKDAASLNLMTGEME